MIWLQLHLLHFAVTLLVFSVASERPVPYIELESPALRTLAKGNKSHECCLGWITPNPSTEMWRVLEWFFVWFLGSFNVCFWLPRILPSATSSPEATRVSPGPTDPLAGAGGAWGPPGSVSPRVGTSSLPRTCAAAQSFGTRFTFLLNTLFFFILSVIFP